MENCRYSHLGWFGGHLDASLENGDGEARMRGTAQPQAEILVGCVHLMIGGGTSHQEWVGDSYAHVG